MGGQPVPVVDDQTNRRYYLIPAENLEQLLAGQMPQQAVDGKTESPSARNQDEQYLGAMAIRATWMREMGLSEDEVREHCQAGSLDVNLEDEQASLDALRRIQNRR
jgi:hypothetical protein